MTLIITAMAHNIGAGMTLKPLSVFFAVKETKGFSLPGFHLALMN
jgi:hypothetical protein